MSVWQRRFRKLKEHPHPVRAVASRLLWHAGVSSYFVIELPRGFRVRFYPSSISAALWADPGARREDEDFVWAVLRPGDRYIDAGANIGQLALAAAMRVGDAGQVFAIEAHPRVYEFLKGNVELNQFGVVQPIHQALGAKSGVLSFTDRRSDDQNHPAPDGDVSVAMNRLDDVVTPASTRLLKLDVEGFELQVLQGAPETLRATDIVYCELVQSNCARFEYDAREVELLLLREGFRFIAYYERSEPIVCDEPFFDSMDAAALPATGYNLIAVRPNVGAEVLARLRDAGWFSTH